MSRFILHGVPGSPYVRAVLLALEEKGADWQLRTMAMGENKTSEYRALQPFGKIPVLFDGDFHLYETHAILRYLDRVLTEPPLVPADPKRAARMDQVISITNAHVRPEVSGAITFPRLVAPKFGLPVDESAIPPAVPAAENCIAALAALIDDQPYMAGSSISLADLMLVPHLDYFEQCAEGGAALAPYPGLMKWLGRMRERPSMAATSWERLLEANEAV
jgi:glutathione S-transferase